MMKLVNGTITTLVAAGLVAVGCAPEQGTADQAGDRAAADQVSEAEFREHVEEAYDTYIEAVRTGDLETAAMIWSEDIRVRGTQGFEDVQGRDEAFVRFAESADQYTLESMDVDVQDVVVLGDHAWESGTYSETFVVGEQQVELEGAYAALWRLEADGRWRMFRYIWNEHAEEEG